MLDSFSYRTINFMPFRAERVQGVCDSFSFFSILLRIVKEFSKYLQKSAFLEIAGFYISVLAKAN